MPINPYLIQGLSLALAPQKQDIDENGNLRVEAPGVMPRLSQPPYLQIPPDTVGRSQLEYTPTQADVPSLSMPAQEALGQKYEEYPIFKPGFGTRLVSSLAAGSAGHFQGPMAGLQTGQAYMRAPWQEKLQTWQSEAAPVMYKAGAEASNFKNALERAKLQGTIGLGNTKNMVDVSNANTAMEASETRRYNAKTAAQQANVRNFIGGQPNYGFKETGEPNNEFVGFDPKSGTTIRTGVKGQPRFRDIEELKQLMRFKYKELGEMLRNIPQRDVYGAIDNALRMQMIKFPQLYGKFADKNGFIDAEKTKGLSTEDQKLLRQLIDAATQEAKQELMRSKNLKSGVLSNPIRELPDGSKILNYDDDTNQDTREDQEEQE